MSRAAFMMALSKVLKRQPTEQDMATFCGELAVACPEGRVYIPTKPLTDSELEARIVNLHSDGMGIRAIARELKVRRVRVREVLRVGPVAACAGPTP